MGIELTGRTKDSVKISNDGSDESYDVLIEFPFDSTRKRMSVVIKDGSKYALLTKGADNIMKPRIQWKPKEKETVDDHLHDFAIQGLRTLVMAKKEISQQEFTTLKDKLDTLESSSFSNKEEQIFELYDKFEQGLSYIGASAIEDKLQDDVAETISILMEANIRVWVLTGDKQETAIEIAKSCQLIQTGMEAEILTIDLENCKREPAFLLYEKISELKDKYAIKATASIERSDETINTSVKKKYISASSDNNLISTLSIVIDGPTLGVILRDPELEFEFFKLAIYAKSVVCCRVSPKQKALVVKLARYKRKSISLSIGDGANDVPMIMEANIGVGIRGKEGTQAVRSADYAIGQFKFLRRLVLVHGRYGYRRISWIV